MSIAALVWWAFLAAALAVAVVAAAGPGLRCVREVQTLFRRLGALADLPILAQAARAEADLERLGVAAGAVGPLVMRAQAAVAEIRGTPLVPVPLTRLVAGVRAEVSAFRQAARR